jgi:DNA polymerase III subunit beta
LIAIITHSGFAEVFMKVSVLQENLAKGLSIVGRAVPAKSTLPVLSNILLSTDQSRLKLSATNLEIGITCWVGAKIEDEGAITVPARLLSEYISNLPNERIDMELVLRTHTLNLSCARVKTNIKGIDAEEFPLIPVVTDKPTAILAPALLRQMIAQVAFAAATDESRPVLAGVLASFDSGAGTFTLAAADGFRLSVRNTPFPGAPDEMGKLDVIIPARTLLEVARVLSSIDTTNDGAVEITVTPNKSQVLFHMNDVDVVSRLIEGAFPNYQQIIPKTYKTRSLLNTADFLRSTRRASIFARDSANVIRMSLNPGEDITPGRVTISATAAELGDNEEEMDGVIEGESVQVAFNARYLADVLGVLDTTQVILETTSPSSPGVLKPAGAEGQFVHVIMPMHVAR